MQRSERVKLVLCVIEAFRPLHRAHAVHVSSDVWHAAERCPVRDLVCVRIGIPRVRQQRHLEASHARCSEVSREAQIGGAQRYATDAVATIHVDAEHAVDATTGGTDGAGQRGRRQLEVDVECGVRQSLWFGSRATSGRE